MTIENIHQLPKSSQSKQEWRDNRYQRFYAVADQVVGEILDLPNEDGTRKRKVAGEQLNRLRYSVEVLIRDTVAIVLHRKRKGEAAIHRGQYAL